MGIFGGSDKGKKREVEAEAPKKEVPLKPLEDQVAQALPQRSTFFNAMRTNAFVNHNIVENYVEFWSALQVDAEQDKWRVMHYMVYDLDRKDGKFVSEQVTKQDVNFAEAVAQIAKAEYTASKLITHADFDVEVQYPPQLFPEMKVHFYDLEHYKKAANIEGIAFDEYNIPYRRVDGKIFQSATFKRSEVRDTILAVEQARDNEKVQAKIEGGILSDLFATASDRVSSLDNILKIGQVLSTMDNFATQVGAFYLAIQKATNDSYVGMRNSADPRRKDEIEKLDASIANLATHGKFARIEGLTPEEKEDILNNAKGLVPSGMNEKNGFRKIIEEIIPDMYSSLESVKAQGVHVEPFQKFTAELELYANLLYASQNLAKLERGFASVSNSDTSLITEIRQSVDRAQKKFLDLGGTQDQMVKLKAWVANPKKDPIPGWVPGFLTRYYTSRAKVMQKVQDRQAGLTQVNTMTTEVKPPVTDEFNANTLKQQVVNDNKEQAQPAATADNADSLDKFTKVMGPSSRPKRDNLAP